MYSVQAAACQGQDPCSIRILVVMFTDVSTSSWTTTSTLFVLLTRVIDSAMKARLVVAIVSNVKSCAASWNLPATTQQV
jgi:hypothetical protein